MSEDKIININPEKPELTPAQSYREGLKKRAENDAGVYKKDNKETDEALLEKRKFEESLPQRQDDAMAGVTKAMEASKVEEDAQRAKDIQQATRQGDAVLERTGRMGYQPVSEVDSRCHSCFDKQEEQKKYNKTSYNFGGQTCSDCGHELVILERELT